MNNAEIRDKLPENLRAAWNRCQMWRQAGTPPGDLDAALRLVAELTVRAEKAERERDRQCPIVIRTAMRVLIGHVEPGWENCVTVVTAWLDSINELESR